MNALENYKAVLEQHFGSGAAKFNTTGDATNNIIGALNRTEFASFRSVFHKRCERLAAHYSAADPNRKPLLTRLNEMADKGKWNGAYAEMVAFDFLNSDQDWLSTPITLSKTVSATETLAYGLGNQNANFDGYYGDFDVCFDVKVLGDKSRDILDGVITEATRKLGSTALTIIPEYPLDLGHEEFEVNRNQLRKELESLIDVSNQATLIRSSVIPNLTYQIKWDTGVLTAASAYNPYRHAANHHTLLFKHAKKFSMIKPSLIVFVLFPWFSEKVVNPFCTSEVFYRSFSRRFFCQYTKDDRLASSILKSFQGNETVAQVTEKLSGVLFLEDCSITSSNTDGLNVKGFAYLNPSAKKKVGPHFLEHLSGLDFFVDDFEYDNY